MREMADKNWKRMGNLEEFRRDQFERHNLRGLELADRTIINKWHRPMTPVD